MRSEPSVLRDFTVDRRVWLLQASQSALGPVRPLWQSFCYGVSHFQPICSTTIASALHPFLRRAARWVIGWW